MLTFIDRASDTYHGKWHFNKAQKHWEGACSAEVQDVIKSVQHKTNSRGADRTHSIAMSKGFMDRILSWIHLRCQRETYIGLVRMLLEGDKMATNNLTLEMRTLITQMVMYQAFSTTAWNLWTRCFELIKLKRKDLTIDLSKVEMAFSKYLYKEMPSIKDLHACFKVFLLNRKGWQWKVDKGLKEADLRSE
jgi:hypothetical protein